MYQAFAAVAAVIIAFPALAAQRQFVASTGNDANPCTLTFPCRGFAAAAAAVDPGGEIIVLDSAGYGPVILTKSVSIISPAGIYAGISVPAGQDGITINGAGIRVKLDGLTINGTGGNVGIRLLGGTLLDISRCQVTNMSTGGIVSVAPGANVSVRDSIANNNSGPGLVATAALVLNVQSSTFNNNAQVGLLVLDGTTAFLKNVTATLNGTNGINVGAGSGRATKAYIDQSQVNGNLAGGVELVSAGNGTASLDIVRSTVSQNQYGISAVSTGTGVAYLTATENVASENVFEGVKANGGGAVAVATANTIARNGAAGIAGVSGGNAYTSQDNSMSFNTPNIAGSVFAFTKL